MERTPLRGEIWFLASPLDPPGKGKRPVVVVSTDLRNRHAAADAVLVVPLTTTTHKPVPTHVILSSGETGLQADSAARCEDIMAVRKVILDAPRQRLRQISNARVCELARKVALAMGCLPDLG